MTVVYPSPGKFDNVKATLTLVANQVRTSTDTSSGYAENPAGSDPRFIYNYAAVPQKIAMGNAQDDPGLFITAIASNIADQRYLPFENAGRHQLLASRNAADRTTRSTSPRSATSCSTSTTRPSTAATDFRPPCRPTTPPTCPPPASRCSARKTTSPRRRRPSRTPIPPAPWQAFLPRRPRGANQTLTLSISPSKFPAWTRGKTISVTSLTVLAVAWAPGSFVLAPAGAAAEHRRHRMTPVAGR